MTKNIILNSREITYNLQRKAVKRLIIRVKNDGTVCVSANKSIPIRDIEFFLREKSSFILKALDDFKEKAKLLPPPQELKTGEKLRYFGELLDLTVEQSYKNTVRFTDEGIVMSVTDTDNFELKRAVLDRWYKAQCEKTVTEICRKLYNKFEPFGVKFPKIKFRKMVSRWGSCRPTGDSVTFNTHLAEVPVRCIEYVAVHEFTHFLYANHSREFYNQVEYFMPDYKDCEKLLKQLEPEIIKK